MRVIEQVLRPGDGRKRQGIFFKHGRQFGCAVGSHVRTQQRHHPVAGPHAVVVGLQTFVMFEVGQAEGIAKDRPGGVADHCQKNLFAIADLEHVINAPGRNALRHGRGGLARHGKLHHVLRHQKHIVFKQRALHFLTLPGVCPLSQRGHCANGAEHAAHDVVDAGAGA